MESIDRIKAHYDFTDKDAVNLKSLAPMMERHADEFPEQFYLVIKNLEEADTFLKDDATIERHQAGLKRWFRSLFCGEYGSYYLREIEHVGLSHVKIHLPCHYVNMGMHFVKRYCHEILRKEVPDADERRYLVTSLEKILDINLDALTSSYVEEEVNRVFLSQKLESYLIQFANRFSYGLNLVLVVGLVIIGIMVLVLFGYDLMHILDSGDMEKGLLATLGSLLMLWVVIELVDTEIEHLKGAKFTIKVFISVALVAVIRKILVTSLKTDAVEAQLSLVVAVAVLGGVYWLVSKAEK
ncbi:MAG: protoglobin domain-containing protein [Thermodesulfobacteriota bacterium]